MANTTTKADDKVQDKVDEQATTTQAVDPAVGFANSAQAATGEVVSVPKTPKEIAKQGTELGLAGDFATGGNASTPADSVGAPQFVRLWGMDADHNTDERATADSLKPDCAVQVS